MYAEDELLPLSGLQHLLYCERQCALIHVEAQWAENRFTAEGNLNHERVHSGGRSSAPGLRTAFSLHLRSLTLGLSGVADVVEFRQPEGAKPGDPWQPFPVEHKRGKPKPGDADRVQLCAQAICLEEMLDANIPAGALFSGQTRRRQDVSFDAPLRAATRAAAQRFHALMAEGRTPPARYETARCDACSLLSLCQPKAAGGGRGVKDYLASALAREDA